MRLPRGNLDQPTTSDEEGRMHARVSTITGTPDQADAGISNFRENVVPFTREDGGKGSLFLVDRQTGKAMAITLWESEEAMKASEEKANQLRAQAVEQGGGTQAATVERYEVAVFET
jgi:heme-degrading monooxygenase HmoA